MLQYLRAPNPFLTDSNDAEEPEYEDGFGGGRIFLGDGGSWQWTLVQQLLRVEELSVMDIDILDGRGADIDWMMAATEGSVTEAFWITPDTPYHTIALASMLTSDCNEHCAQPTIGVSQQCPNAKKLRAVITELSPHQKVHTTFSQFIRAAVENIRHELDADDVAEMLSDAREEEESVFGTREVEPGDDEMFCPVLVTMQEVMNSAVMETEIIAGAAVLGDERHATSEELFHALSGRGQSVYDEFTAVLKGEKSVSELVLAAKARYGADLSRWHDPTAWGRQALSCIADAIRQKQDVADFFYGPDLLKRG